MRAPLRFPIRFKILISVLIVITAVVSIITFTMANLFHDDKKTYIHDLASVVAQNTAEEAKSLLDGYRERLQVYARVLYVRDLSEEQKREVLKRLLEDFREFVAVTVYEDGKEQATVYDVKALEAAGLTKKELQEYRRVHPLPLDIVRTRKVYIENSSVSAKLPAMTMAIVPSELDGRKAVVVAAFLKLDGLIRITRRLSVFETFLVDDRGVLLAHRDPVKVLNRAGVIGIPKLEGVKQGKTAVATAEFSQGGRDMIGGFARVEPGVVLAGAQIPMAAAYIASRSLLNSLVAVSLILLVVAAVLSLFWSRRITRPIERLSSAARTVGKGRFDIRVQAESRDEIGDLAGTFNEMTSELNAREEALKQAQAQLIQSEKMAAFGQLGAGIAHEVKNPLAGILGYVQLSLRKVGAEDPLHENLKIIEKETKRCRTIIDNLLKFARQEKVVYSPIEVNRVAEDTATLLDHQLGTHQIKLLRTLSPGLPAVTGNANQLQQVLMNLIINAEQAMEGQPGSIELTTSLAEDGRAEIRVRDTGPGIPREIQDRIFEPFYTTKPAGKGTGLGLSVSYGIIKEHKGDIHVESEPGQGAAFVIRLPVADTPELSAAAGEGETGQRSMERVRR